MDVDRHASGGSVTTKPQNICDWQNQANLVGQSQSFVDALFLIGRVAQCDAPVLLSGETGTGKELAARAVHYLGRRRNGPFVPVNCAAIPDTLIESELFGHAKGAFSGATCARRGLARQASGGTLFLDEVEALSPRAQGVLLRFLQDGSFRPVGDDHASSVDVRIVAASNVDMQRKVDAGEMRQDLMYRLMVLTVDLPPLRERQSDIKLLTDHFLKKVALMLCGTQRRLTPQAVGLLTRYRWPGNVRELEHLILRAHLTSDEDELTVDHLLRCAPMLASAKEDRREKTSLLEAKRLAVARVERDFVMEALQQARGNISEVARTHKLDRAFVSRLVRKHLAAHRG
jgi:two-component system, NtrC family, response regulator GlrR